MRAGIYRELTHPVKILVADWDHASPSKSTTYMGTRALGIPMPISPTVDAVPWLVVHLIVCSLKVFDGLIDEGELD